MNSRVNSYAVAKAAGVSRSVVSLVIHGAADRHNITKETQERVRQAIQRLGYTPDLSVRNMFLGKSAGLLRMAAERMEAQEFVATLAPLLAQKGFRVVPVGDAGGGAPEPKPSAKPQSTPAPGPVP